LKKPAVSQQLVKLCASLYFIGVCTPGLFMLWWLCRWLTLLFVTTCRSPSVRRFILCLVKEFTDLLVMRWIALRCWAHCVVLLPRWALVLCRSTRGLTIYSIFQFRLAGRLC